MKLLHSVVLLHGASFMLCLKPLVLAWSAPPLPGLCLASAEGDGVCEQPDSCCAS